MIKAQEIKNKYTNEIEKALDPSDQPNIKMLQQMRLDADIDLQFRRSHYFSAAAANTSGVDKENGEASIKGRPSTSSAHY